MFFNVKICLNWISLSSKEISTPFQIRSFTWNFYTIFCCCAQWSGDIGERVWFEFHHVKYSTGYVEWSFSFVMFVFITSNHLIRTVYLDMFNLVKMIWFCVSWTDYLVDEGAECNASSDLLLERNRDQSLVDLLVPSLVLLINLLQKLQVCPF